MPLSDSKEAPRPLICCWKLPVLQLKKPRYLLRRSKESQNQGWDQILSQGMLIWGVKVLNGPGPHPVAAYVLGWAFQVLS